MDIPFPTTPWLRPEEHRYVVEQLLRFGLIKCSAERNLPLSNKGLTDIYINLRQMRNDARATEFLTQLYARPLMQLEVNRFAEVPQAVSGLAGSLSTYSGLPYLTIRDNPKAGRASDAELIGEFEAGDTVPLVDDVITDGASKLPALALAQRRRFKIPGIIVLVDRQQGWKKVLFEARYGETGVWAGMTLHDVRRQLIEMGVMERCSVDVEAANNIVLALDNMSWEEALPLIEPLRTTGAILKVNDLVFDQGFAHLLPNLSVYGRVLVDLKSHDIPQTMENVLRKLRIHRPWAITVHASGGCEMVKKAVEMLQSTGTKVLAVTVLTSLDNDDCERIYNQGRQEQVLQLAEMAFSVGADGFVCSANEVRGLRAQYPDKIFLVPGTRSPGASAGSQKNVTSHAQAIENGATHIVLGSQATKSQDPVAEVNRVRTEEIAGVTYQP